MTRAAFRANGAVQQALYRALLNGPSHGIVTEVCATEGSSWRQTKTLLDHKENKRSNMHICKDHVQARKALDEAHTAIFKDHRQRSGEPYSVDDVLSQLKAASALGLSLEQHAGLLGLSPDQLRPYKDYLEQFPGE